MGISYLAHLGCESPDMVSEHHTLFLHLRPELGSERRIDDRLQVENVQVGDVAIVPAHANHWQGIEQDIAEAVILTLEPQFLAYTTSELINPARVELLPTFAQPDPLIYGIGLTLKNALEMGMCDRIYFESLFTSLSIHLLRHYSTHKPVLQEYAGGLPKYKLKQAIAYITSMSASAKSITGRNCSRNRHEPASLLPFV